MYVCMYVCMYVSIIHVGNNRFGIHEGQLGDRMVKAVSEQGLLPHSSLVSEDDRELLMWVSEVIHKTVDSYHR